MRLVIDTNIWVSALIGANTGALFTILANPDIVLIQCSELFTEIETVLKRPEFQKYLPESDINDFLNYFTAFTEQVTLPPFEDNICRYPKDSYLLVLSDIIWLQAIWICSKWKGIKIQK